MKFHIAYANARGETDGVTAGQLFNHLERVSPNAADVILIVAVCHDGFHFNHELNKLVGKKPIIIVDYLEYGWQYPHDEDNVLGHGGCFPCGDCHNQEWGTFNSFVAQANPILQFKRELRKLDMSDRVIPIDFLAHLPKQPLSTKAQFDARPIEVFNSWGYSHPSRARVHADMFHAMGTQGINLLDSYDAFGGNAQPWAARTWLSVFTPHWKRRPMTEVLEWQSKSKISLSLYGAGWKCFRHTESPENSIMAMQANNLAWSYPWDDTNSIQMYEPHEVADLLSMTSRSDLFDVYIESQVNIERYRRAQYIPEYFIRNIAERL